MNELTLTQMVFADSNIKWDENRLSIYRQFACLYNNDYKAVIKLLYNYYKDKPFKESSLDKFVFQHQDIIEKTLNRLTAGVLDKKPTRLLVNGETKWEDLEYVLDKVSFHEKIYESFHKASFVNIAQFYPTFRNDKISIDIYTPESYLVQVTEKDFLTADKFLLICTEIDGGQYLVYWDEDSHYIYNSMGDRVAVENNEEMVNPYGAIPLAELRLKNGTNYFGEPDWNLFLNQLAIDMKITQMDFTEWFQRGSILHGINTKFPDGQIINPYILLQTESKIPSEQVSLNYLNGNVDFTSWKDGIEWRTMSTLRSKGIVGSSASIDSTDTSGFSKEMDEISLKENRDRHINKLVEYEKRAFNILRTVWNYHVSTGELDEMMIPVDYEYQVSYVNYEPTLNPTEIKAKRDMQKSFYIKDEIDFIKEDLGLDEEKAIEHYNKLKQRAIDLGLTAKAVTTGTSLRERLNNATI